MLLGAEKNNRLNKGKFFFTFEIITINIRFTEYLLR
jgi:hypothetical protein